MERIKEFKDMKPANLSDSNSALFKNGSFNTTGNISDLDRGDNQTIEEFFPEFEMPDEDKIILGFLSLLGLLVVVANVTVLGLAMKHRFLRSKPNYIIMSLALSDFFSGAAAIPLLVACNATFQEPLCIGMDVCQRFLAISTILHIAADVMNRYFRIVKPFVYRKSVTFYRLVLSILLLWVVSLACALVQIIWIRDRQSEKQFVYNLAIFVIFVFLPFLIIVSACAQMFRAIRRRKDFRGESNKIKKIKRTECRALVVYGMMTFCFAIGWFPYFLMTILEDAGFRIMMPYWLSIALLFLKYGTSLVDPLLYALMKNDFQKGLKNSMNFSRREEDELYSIQMELLGKKTFRSTSSSDKKKSRVVLISEATRI